MIFKISYLNLSVNKKNWIRLKLLFEKNVAWFYFSSTVFPKYFLTDWQICAYKFLRFYGIRKHKTENRKLKTINLWFIFYKVSNNGYCLESPGVYLAANITKCGTYSTPHSNQVKLIFFYLLKLLNFCLISFLKFWYLTKYNEIRFDTQCLIYNAEEKAIYSTDCIDDKGKNKWTYKNGRIRLLNTNDCIQTAPQYNKVFMSKCSILNKLQTFDWPTRIS